MSNFKNKITYLGISLKKKILREGLTCPSCGSKQSQQVDSKYLVTSLQRCDNCRLLFRIPTTSQLENNKFYQKNYSQGFTSEMPSDEQLEKLFKGKELFKKKEYDAYIRVLKKLGCSQNTKLFDFGCSWGYGSWHLAQAGFKVKAFEISEPRRQFAENKLGIQCYHSLDSVNEKFDVFFSAHVLEHVPSPTATIQFALSVLKPGGLFIAFTPNGCEEFRKKYYEKFNKLWGLVHPQMLDDVYYNHIFNGYERYITSSPYIDEICELNTPPNSNGISGDELLFIAQKPVETS
jgi:2-polyprenyl-3-methyl-5-hydroxy-6-metoxy-1,4-benzoquinol methylase